jgi:hypothetical protein
MQLHLLLLLLLVMRLLLTGMVGAGMVLVGCSMRQQLLMHSVVGHSGWKLLGMMWHAVLPLLLMAQ